MFKKRILQFRVSRIAPRDPSFIAFPEPYEIKLLPPGIAVVSFLSESGNKEWVWIPEKEIRCDDDGNFYIEREWYYVNMTQRGVTVNG